MAISKRRTRRKLTTVGKLRAARKQIRLLEESGYAYVRLLREAVDGIEANGILLDLAARIRAALPPSLLDWARKADPSGRIDLVCGILSANNTILDDMVLKPVKKKVSHGRQ